ncbi:DUF6518 family protein [Faecalimicrobium dakarense]|uniref:DUF6518 family protein n=1 Tax=Faecalimicrobium dakarense TaxID=1301100 RepID=UPI0004B1343D|nr:hypothetical protein [[Clostridium] dakarense]
MTNLKEKLNEIRQKEASDLSIYQKFIRVLLVFIFGAVMGILAKYTDGTIIGLIGTYLGIWIFIATLISVYSRSPEAGAIHVFAFFMAMLLAYYIYSMKLFGFFPGYYFFAWVGVALLTPIGAYVVWYSKGNNLISSIFASLPISVLLWEGYSFYYTFSMPEFIDIVFAVLLLFILSKNSKQIFRTIFISIVLFFVILKSDIIYLFIGGL